MNSNLKVCNPVFPVKNWEKLSEQNRFNLSCTEKSREILIKNKTKH